MARSRKRRTLTPAQLADLHAMYYAEGGALERWAEKIKIAKATGEPEFLAWLANLRLSEGLSYLEPRATPRAGDALATAIDIARNASGRGDILSTATEIARNAASAREIDWTREPLTEREGKVRAALLTRARSRFYESPMTHPSLSRLHAESELTTVGVALKYGFGREGCDHLASDVRSVWYEIFDESERRMAAKRMRERDEAIEKAIAEVDGSPA